MSREKVLSCTRMILVEQGEGSFSLDGRLYPFSTGALLFGFKGENFKLCSGNNVRYIYIDFDGVKGNSLLGRFNITPYSRIRNGCNSLIPFCMDCLVSTPPENVDMVGECVLLYVLSRLKINNCAENDTVQSIISFTEKNFRDPDLSISMIANKIGYNPKYLSHFFKEKMQVTYSEYLRSFRFKYAISLFELGLSSVKNVAILSGFSDPLYFSASFKKVVGISPSEFIATLSGKEENE